MESTHSQIPDLQALRNESLLAGAVDPMTLRFRIVEFDRWSGELLGVPVDNIGFPEALETTASLIESRSASNFCLEPTGFIQ